MALSRAILAAATADLGMAASPSSLDIMADRARS
jgi:hypothetical protein